MSTTTTINHEGNGSNTDKKKSAATFAATAATAAGVGVAGATIVSELNNTEDVVTEVAEESIVTPEASESSSAQSATAEQSTSATTKPTSTSTVSQSTTSTAESEPITAEEVPSVSEMDEVAGESVITPEASESSSAQSATTEQSTSATTEPTSTSSVSQSTTSTAEPEPITAEAVIETVNDPINPDEIAEAIISEDQIDSNDIDMADVINFDEIGTVYTVDGESYTAAAFHDTAGNNLVMVDVDGDDVFDVITDYEGNLIAEVPVTMTVDDAEIGVADDGTYLAHNDNENTDEFGAESISQDILA